MEAHGCAFPDCACEVDGGARYCTDSCSEAHRKGKTPPGGCACEHKRCGSRK